MLSATKLEHAKAVVSSIHSCLTSEERVDFYNTWAENYEKDLAVLEYRAPSLATDVISSHFTGDREAATVLDVVCGTGLVAKLMTKHGFRQFVGIDGNKAMLEKAIESGLYQDLKQSMLGEGPLPFQEDSFDVVVICGGLSDSDVHFSVVREMCRTTKPGGYICMTTRANHDNLEYKSALELQLKKMEDERLWSCVGVTEVEKFQRAVSEHDHGYVPGSVYLYQKLQL